VVLGYMLHVVLLPLPLMVLPYHSHVPCREAVPEVLAVIGVHPSVPEPPGLKADCDLSSAVAKRRSPPAKHAVATEVVDCGVFPSLPSCLLPSLPEPTVIATASRRGVSFSLTPCCCSL